jgi:hypothetical protein
VTRRRYAASVTLVLSFGGAVTAACTSHHAADQAPPPTSAGYAARSAEDILQSARATALRSGSVAYQRSVLSDQSRGKSAVDVSGIAGVSIGIQALLPPRGRVETVVVDGVAYTKGDRPGLRGAGLPERVVPLLADRWWSVVAANPAYRGVAHLVTLPALLAEVTRIDLRTLQREVADRRYVRVTGSLSGSPASNIAIEVSIAEPHLIRSVTRTNLASGDVTTWEFSNWEKPLVVERPVTEFACGALLCRDGAGRRVPLRLS